MREQDKPFLMVRRGRFSFSITPRGTKGWIQFALWMAPLALIILAFVLYAKANEGAPTFVVGLALFIAALIGWNLAMIWWMKARAEVVDIEEILRAKRELERKQHR